MKRCSVKPYEGNEKYIFVSYCHKDKKYVFPIIEQLARDGYRVWYDEGIDPGSEWPEIIARHLNGSASCIAFISDNSLDSHNCRREINFALLKKKSFISVILEEVHMSLGMEMQLSATQSIFKYTLSTDGEFFEKLYEAKFLRECLGDPNPEIIVSSPDEYGNEGNHLFSENCLKRDTFSDKWFVENETSSSDREESASEDEKTSSEPLENDKTKYSAWLIRTKTNERINLLAGETKLGRSETICDYIISGNSAVGRYHMKIVNSGTDCKVIDNNSLNKTFLNGGQLEPQQEYVLKDGDAVRLANEKFVFYQSNQ
ncbi:MAG: TIR domain-containing protein [Eubacterium sp.]